MRELYGTVAVKGGAEPEGEAFQLPAYVPTLTYGHEFWVMTKRTKSQTRAAEISFLRRVAGFGLRDVRNSE